MSGLSPALAAQLQAVIDRWSENQAQFSDWLAGTAGGGPNSDGRYPLTNAQGVEVSVASPASIMDMVEGPAAQAQVAKLAAQSSASAAATSASNTDAAKVLAEAAKTAAVAARNLAQTAQSNASNHEANARHWAELAIGKGGEITVMVQTVTDLAQQVAADAVAAEANAQSAGISAGLAATFEPNNFDLKSDPIEANRITGTISVANLPVMPGPAHFASTGGFADLTSAQQSAIKSGDFVTITDGRRWVYKGSGSKTVEASYIKIADDTPSWDMIDGRPTTFLPSVHSHNHTDINGLTWANLGSKPLTFAPSAHGHDWSEITGKPSTFTATAHTHVWADITDKPTIFASNIANVSGLQSALDAKLSSGAAVTVTSVAFNTGFLYPDGNHSVLKTGTTGAEKYWRFDSNGSLYALSGGFDSASTVRSSSSVIVGPNDGAANSSTMGPGYMELRSAAYGAYIDLSNAASGSMDFGGRLQYAGTSVILSNGAGGSLVVGAGNAYANSSDGSQSGKILTENGGQQAVSKIIAFVNSGQKDFHTSISEGLEVRSSASDAAAKMRFHRPGAFGVEFGLGTDNQMRVGGWSLGTVSYRLWTEQNFDPTNFVGGSINGGSSGLTVSGAGGINVAGSGGIKSTGSGGFTGTNYKLSSGDGQGIKFWNGNDSYSITMGSSTWGGRVPGETTSDYNIYFRMDGGTNRGFVFKSGTTNVGGIDANGTLRVNGNVESGAEIYCSSWFRVRGPNQGIYWEQHGGGWHMTDSTYLRAYNGKNIYTSGFMQAGNIKFGTNVDVGLYSDTNNIAFRTPHAQGTFYLQGNNGQSTYGIIGDGSINWYRSTWMNGNHITFNGRGLSNGIRFQHSSERDLRFIQKAENWLHWTNETDGYEIAGLDCFGNFNTRLSITSPSLTATSDRTLKQAIRTFEDALTIIPQIRPVRFEWKADDRPDIGVIAQEFEAVVPELVRTADDGVKSVNYNGLTVINTAAIQALMKQVADQGQRIRDLEERR